MVDLSMKFFRYCLVSVFLLTAIGGSSTAQVVIVVNEQNPIDDISLKDLQKIFLGKKTQFDHGEMILLGEYGPAKDDFCKFVFKWSVQKMKKYWMKEIFSGSSIAPPIHFKSINDVAGFIVKNPAAICYINNDEIGEGMKVLTIGGESPGSFDYPLK